MINVKELLDMVDIEYGNKVQIDKYQIIDIYLNEYTTIESIIKDLKFKKIGNVYDYPELLTPPERINFRQLSADYEWIEGIAISSKYNAIMNFTNDSYCMACKIIIDNGKLKKFTEKLKHYVTKDSPANLFKDIEFPTLKGEYLDVSDTSDEEKRLMDIYTKEIDKTEKLIFDEESTINDVVDDINLFFDDKTTELYKELNIPYKRGVILYGPPGNGKSAMIREMIRKLDGVVKIIINPGIENVTKTLSDLFSALKGQKSLIILEDVETIINNCNRSELLNVLDGVSIKSGMYLIGTTNYPDSIDPAFMNRSGRFDKSYEIKNPGVDFRTKYFEASNILTVLKKYNVFKDKESTDRKADIISLFVQNSEDLPMANLKEIITSTCYTLALHQSMSIEEAVTKTYEVIKGNREKHMTSVNQGMDMAEHISPMRNRKLSRGRRIPRVPLSRL